MDYEQVKVWRIQFDEEMQKYKSYEVPQIRYDLELSAEDCVFLWGMQIGTGD